MCATHSKYTYVEVKPRVISINVLTLPRQVCGGAIWYGYLHCTFSRRGILADCRVLHQGYVVIHSLYNTQIINNHRVSTV